MLRGIIPGKTCAALLACASVLVGCGDTGSVGTLTEPAPSATFAAPGAGGGIANESGYRLGAGDKISVIVFGENDLSGEFLVGDSGVVDLPLIGSVPAAGATIAQFQDGIVQKLSAGYLKDPKVSVSVLNYRPFFITGEVGKGGEYPYKAGLTVQDAVAIAGGYTYRANTSQAYVRRAGQDREVAVELNQRVAINPGDIIRIPERFF